MVLKPNPRFSQRKQGLIVLSFFDGLGSAPHIATTWLQHFEVRRIFAWETDGDLAKLSQERFGALLVHRGDFVADGQELRGTGDRGPAVPRPQSHSQRGSRVGGSGWIQVP